MLSGNLHKMIWNIGIQDHMNEQKYMFQYSHHKCWDKDTYQIQIKVQLYNTYDPWYHSYFNQLYEPKDLVNRICIACYSCIKLDNIKCITYYNTLISLIIIK